MADHPLELADVVRRFAPACRARHGDRLLPSQQRALDDIAACMTAAMGGGRYHCHDCEDDFWSYHGGRDRSCPRCHGRQVADWLQTRTAELLPCDYSHVGAQVGMLAVLHTVNGAHDAPNAFLVPVRKLSPMIAQRFAHALRTLARYVFRIALTNARLLEMDDTHVTFRYEVRHTGGGRTERLDGRATLRCTSCHTPVATRAATVRWRLPASTRTIAALGLPQTSNRTPVPLTVQRHARAQSSMVPPSAQRRAKPHLSQPTPRRTRGGGGVAARVVLAYPTCQHLAGPTPSAWSRRVTWNRHP